MGMSPCGQIYATCGAPDIVLFWIQRDLYSEAEWFKKLKKLKARAYLEIMGPLFQF